MPINRTQASKLLNASELALFDAASATGVRALSPAQLQAKVARSRRLRDKYRDQYKRQRLASQARTGSKSGRSGQANLRTRDKAQVFDEVLGRLQARLAMPSIKAQLAAAKQKPAATGTAATPARAKRTAAKPTAANKTAAKKTAAKKTTAKKTTAKKTTAKKTTAKKTTAKPVAANKTAANKTAAKKPDAKKPDAKQTPAPAAARGLFGVPGLSPKAPVPIEPPGAERSDKARTGFMSKDAKASALERHFGEVGGKAIQGHISSLDRRNQGKRDHRGD